MSHFFLLRILQEAIQKPWDGIILTLLASPNSTWRLFLSSQLRRGTAPEPCSHPPENLVSNKLLIVIHIIPLKMGPVKFTWAGGT
jgi:hypothetical protein